MFWDVFETEEVYDELQLFCYEFIEKYMSNSKQGELQKSAAGIAVLEDWPISDETEKAVDDCFDARRCYPSDCVNCGSKCSDYLNYVRLL
ncbi:hypothetical protein TNCV_2855021 [Trichonephila clavipes]|nr:hypothetical protein TNCV_2855021 [Trichonephila clavipes]